MEQQPEKQGNGTIPRPPGNDAEGGVGSPSGKKMKGEWMKLWGFICRACALAFSLLTFILMVCVSDFYLYAGYSYVLVIAIITTVYTAVQVGIKGHELRTKKDVISPKIANWIDFCGDQVLAYMLFSSASAGATTTISLRTLYASVGVDLLAAAVSMCILAFISLAPAAFFSAYRLFSNL